MNHPTTWVIRGRCLNFVLAVVNKYGTAVTRQATATLNVAS